MASGRLGSASLLAATNTTLYTVPTGKTAALTVNVCNTGSLAATVRIALAAADAPVDGEWIEYDVSVPAKGVLERGGIVLDAGKKIVAYASATDVNVTVWGFEE